MSARHPQEGFTPHQGFSLVELMIVIAIIATLVSLALPAYQDFTIRAKVTEGLSLAAGLKVFVSESCQSDPTRSFESIVEAGYSAEISSQYVELVDAATSLPTVSGANCLLPFLGFQSRNTGADVEPLVLLIGVVRQGRTEWLCTLMAGDAVHVPQNCRQNSLEVIAEIVNAPTPP